VAGENASLLTFACSLADASDFDTEAYEIVGVTGNSMGFYTALAVSGALSTDDAIHLVETMGSYQAGNVVGGQVMAPLCDEQWNRQPSLLEGVEATIQAARSEGHQAWWSIDLGSHAILGADTGGIKSLLAALPKINQGARKFPIQLPLHSAFHTPLMHSTSLQAFQELGGLVFKRPQVPLIDGRGVVHRPLSCDPTSLREYTLGAQVTEMFNFRQAIHTALTYCAPDVVVILGPGNTLGGPIARTLAHHGWRGAKTPADFNEKQKSSPMLLSFGVGPQRNLLIRNTP